MTEEEGSRKGSETEDLPSSDEGIKIKKLSSSSQGSSKKKSISISDELAVQHSLEEDEEIPADRDSTCEKKKDSILSDEAKSPKRHLSITWSQTTYEEEKEPKRQSKLTGSSQDEKRLSKAITEFIKQRKPSSEPPDLEDEAQMIQEYKLPVEPYSGERRYSRYSKVIEDLEKQVKESLLQQEDEGLADKKIRFVEAMQDTELVSDVEEMKLVFEVGSKICEQYLKYEDFSNLLVDEVIKHAVIKSSIIQKKSSTKFIEGIQYSSDERNQKGASLISQSSSLINLFEWPTIQNFNIEKGSTKINEFLTYWEFKEDWRYCVNYLKSESDKTCDYHRYEAIFSIPCKQYPIPQATASVYFTMEVSRVKPTECPVNVYYSFEGRRLKHTPGEYKPQEEWLFYIIDAKINFYKNLKF